MKKLFLFLPLMVISLRAQALVPVTLAWDYPPAELTNITFKVYHSTSIALPLTNWVVLTNAISTNQVQVSIAPGVHFFSVTASNFWGESTFSNIASTPALPRSDANLKVQR